MVSVSELLVVAFDPIRETVALLREHTPDPGKTPFLVIGGETIKEQVAQHVGADLWSDDAMEGARRCQTALEERERHGESTV